MRTASFTLEYCVPLPDNLENADEEEIINYVQEYWTDLIDGNHDCWFGDITMIDQQKSGYNGRSFFV